MAEERCIEFVAEANSAIKLFNSMLKRHTNTSNEVKSAAKTCTDGLVAIINQQIDIIRELNNKSLNIDLTARFDAIENNKKELNEINEIKAQISVKSYASVLVSQPHRIRSELEPKKPKNLVIIKPKNEKSDSKQNGHVIREALEKANKMEAIDDVKYISKGGLILNCAKDEDIQEVENIINSQLAEFEAKRAQMRKPKLVIFGVDSDITEDMLIDRIIQENREIRSFLDKETDTKSEHISYKFKFRRKNQENTSGTDSQNSQTGRQKRYSTETYVIEVSAGMRRVIRSMCSIKLGWQSCRVEDYLSITRCYQCNGFGHFKKDCKAGTACGHCGQGHDSHACTAPKSSHHCINCEKFNKSQKSNRKLLTNHSSFSDECESLKRIVDTIKAKISYD
jgi:hypothetical protein